jgi:hypothetical protein
MVKKRGKISNCFWKAYFWYSIVGWVLCFTIFPGIFGNNTLLFWQPNMWFRSIGHIFDLVATLGLFAYAYQKIILIQNFWKIFFYLFLIYEIIEFYTIISEVQVSVLFFVWWFVGALFIFPLYLSIFLYAFKFRSNSIENVMARKK